LIIRDSISLFLYPIQSRWVYTDAIAYRDPRRVLPGSSYSISSGIDQIIDVARTWYRETRKNLSRQFIVIRGVGPKSTKVSSCGQTQRPSRCSKNQTSCSAEHGDLALPEPLTRDSQLSTLNTQLSLPHTCPTLGLEAGHSAAHTVGGNSSALLDEG
jgi:hypothetical protein